MHITVNHTDLYVDVEGPELTLADQALRRRPTIVVVHGGPGFDQGYLRPGLQQLASLAQLVFVDLRGQGRSGPTTVVSCTLEQMADDVAALCDHLGLTQPVIFGHSAGGFVALHLAIRHPGLAGGLILCHTAATLTPQPESPPGPAERGGPQASAAAARLFAGDFSAEAGEAFSHWVLPLYAAPGMEHIPAQLMALTSLDTDIAAYFFQHLAAGYDVRRELPKVAASTLVLVGRHDWVCTPAAGRVLAAAIPGARLVELDAGHFGFSEQPAAFRHTVANYLATLAPQIAGDNTGADRLN